jgi:hypothetical protein
MRKTLMFYRAVHRGRHEHHGVPVLARILEARGAEQNVSRKHRITNQQEVGLSYEAESGGNRFAMEGQ